MQSDGAAAAGVAVDHYDLLGHWAAVALPPGERQAAVRAILRGFGPVPPAAEVASSYALTVAADIWEVRAGEETVYAGGEASTALAALEWRIVTDALDRRDDLFHLHAAALCLPLRRAALALVGDSGNGKSTLALGLSLRGFMPYCDDVALLDPATLAPRPVPRAFHVAPETWHILEPLAGGPVNPDDDTPPGYFLPPQWATQPAPVRWVLFPEYRAGQEPMLLPLTPAEAAGAILKQSTSLARTPRLALATVARLTAEAACYRVITGDLATSVDLIRRLVATDPGREGRQQEGA